MVLFCCSNGLGFNYFGYGKIIDCKNIILFLGNEMYNIFCNYVVYNKEVFDFVMFSDFVYVVIMREFKFYFILVVFYYGFILVFKKVFFELRNVSIGILLDCFLCEFFRRGDNVNCGLVYVNNC